MRGLTLIQPWASAIAMGLKTIETRSWRTPYRGRLLIHAGKKNADPTKPVEFDCPLGVIVAVADLMDVVPIVDKLPFLGVDARAEDHTRCAMVDSEFEPCVRVWTFGVVAGNPCWWSSEGTQDVPWGDFTPGRYAWLLKNTQALLEPLRSYSCPECQGLGKRAFRLDTRSDRPCQSCNGKGQRQVRGALGLWTASPDLTAAVMRSDLAVPDPR